MSYLGMGKMYGNTVSTGTVLTGTGTGTRYFRRVLKLRELDMNFSKGKQQTMTWHFHIGKCPVKLNSIYQI